MSVETITVLITDMQDHIQGIAAEVSRIEALYIDAIEKQDNPSFLRILYKTELNNLEALIAIEEQLYRHAEHLRVAAGISSTAGDNLAGQPERGGKTH